MIGESLLLAAMRWVLWGFATGCGSIGIFALWGSFHIADCGFYAIMLLSTASLIILGMPHPAGAVQGWPKIVIPAALAAKLRRLAEYCRIPLRFK